MFEDTCLLGIPLEQLAQDLWHARLMMIRNRLFIALVVLTLALGIGANAALRCSSKELSAQRRM